jgi:hypothetical protein
MTRYRTMALQPQVSLRRELYLSDPPYDRVMNYDRVHGWFQDELGWPHDHNAHFGVWDITGSFSGGPYGTSPFDFIYQKYVPWLVMNGPIWRTSDCGAMINMGQNYINSVATNVLARTNPNRPYVSLPVAIGELRDIPRTIKDLGDFRLAQFFKSPLSKSGKFYLAEEFGLKPLFSDILKCANFHNAVERKRKEIQSLSTGRGLRRRVPVAFGTENIQGNFGVADSSAGFVCTTYVEVQSTAERWAVVRWHPDSAIPEGDAYRSALARDLAYGLYRGDYLVSLLSDIWNLVPWTWLVDWFTNIGDFIDANRNSIPVHHDAVNVMEKWTNMTRHTVTAPSQLAGTQYTIKGSATWRLLGSPTLAATMPFLSASQLSILGALSVSRRR